MRFSSSAVWSADLQKDSALPGIWGRQRWWWKSPQRWKILMSANWSLYLFFLSFGLDLCFDVSLSRPSRFDVHISKPKIDRRKFSFSSWNTKLKDRNSRSWLGSQNRLLVRLALFDTLVFFINWMNYLCNLMEICWKTEKLINFWLNLILKVKKIKLESIFF